MIIEIDNMTLEKPRSGDIIYVMPSAFQNLIYIDKL